MTTMASGINSSITKMSHIKVLKTEFPHFLDAVISTVCSMWCSASEACATLINRMYVLILHCYFRFIMEMNETHSSNKL